MADIDIEQRPRGSILPWLVALAILIVLVGWLLWRNNRLPEIEGSLLPAREAPALEAPAFAVAWAARIPA